MKPLTDQQQKILDFVGSYTNDHGYPPALRDIGQAIGLVNVNAVRGHLTALEKKGYITKDPDKARSIRVVHVPSPFSQIKRKLHEALRTNEGVTHHVVYNLAWFTRRRQPFLTGAIREVLSELMEREAVEHGWELQASHIEPDHIVIAVAVWPNHSPEQTVRRFRTAGDTLKKRFPRELPEKDLWEKGYIVTTDTNLLKDHLETMFKENKPQGLMN